MMSLSWRSVRMWQRNLDVFFRLWRSEAPGFIIEPAIILLTLGLGLGAYVVLAEGLRYIEFIAPGLVAAYAMFSAAFECTYGSFVRMEHQNTYDAILATPLSAEDITAGEILWGATRAAITGTAILAISAAFQLVASPWALLIPPVIFLVGVMFSAISMVFTSLAPAIHSFNYFYSLFVNPMFFLSGVFFPLDAFPQIIQDLSWISPLTPAVILTRGLFEGDIRSELLLALLLVFLWAAVFFAVSLVTMRRRLVR